MSYFVEQLRLAEKAAEDIYFAKISRELIESLRNRIQADKDPISRTPIQARKEYRPAAK